MEAKRTLFAIFGHIFVVFTCFASVNTAVFSSTSGVTLQNPRIVKLNVGDGFDAVLHRAKRSTGKQGSRNSNGPGHLSNSVGSGANKTDGLQLVFHDLKCEHHNEAVVHWCGAKSEVIFILTRVRVMNGSIQDSSLWRSSDYGNTFKEVKLPGKPLINTFYVSQVDKQQLMFTDVLNRRILRTADEGATYQSTVVPRFSPDRVLYHPKKANWAICYSYMNHSLYLSKDKGFTWNLVQERVQARYFWANPNLESNNTIHMEVIDPLTGLHQYKRCNVDQCTNDDANIIMKGIDIYSLLVRDNYIFVQKKSERMLASKLFVSYKRKPFSEARFPHKLRPLDFNILNSEEGQVFIAVNFMEKVVHLYLSDETGTFYSTTLVNVLHMPIVAGFAVDFYEVHSMHGVYITNQLSPTSKLPITKITYDKGGDWSVLPAPDVDSLGRATNCKLPECSLHLHLDHSSRAYSIPYIISDANAPGIIIAQGSLGSELNASIAHLYMSSDGGYSWREVFKGTYGVNIIDQGGAIIAVKEDFFSRTNIVRYSCDEGRTWTNFTMHDQPIYVDGLLNEPGITKLEVSIFGHRNRSYSSCWTIINLNFTDVLKRKCDPLKDFHDWIPSNLDDRTQCILGRKQTYKRRKVDSRCYLGKDYSHQIKQTVCTCTQEDYECDYGYNDDQSGCVKLSWYDDMLPRSDYCPLGKTFNQSTGYRKVVSDVCNGGKLATKYAPKVVPCPILKPQGMKITASQYPYAETHHKIVFSLEQDKGTESKTSYQWEFGDGSQSSLIKGFDKANSISHKYTTSGDYKVTVSGTNSDGTETTSTILHLEDRIRAVHVTCPRVAQVDTPLTFNVSVTNRRHVEFQAIVHYLWLFGDEDRGNTTPLLTYDTRLQHTYKKAGTKSVLVQAVNGLGSQLLQFDIEVYALVRTVRLGFSPYLRRFSQDGVVWRSEFQALLLNKLLSVLTVERNQLSVTVHSGSEVVADVFIYPLKTILKHDSGVDKLVRELLDVANYNHSWPFGGIRLLLHDHVRILVTSAVEVPTGSDDVIPGPDGPAGIRINMTAVFIAVPIIVLILIVIPLVVRYYFRRSREFRHYRVLQNHAMEADTILDDDDDEPLLDAGHNFGGNIQDEFDGQSFYFSLKIK